MVNEIHLWIGIPFSTRICKFLRFGNGTITENWMNTLQHFKSVYSSIIINNNRPPVIFIICIFTRNVSIICNNHEFHWYMHIISKVYFKLRSTRMILLCGHPKLLNYSSSSYGIFLLSTNFSDAPCLSVTSLP